MPRETAIPLPTRKKAALYLRVSTDQQTEKYGLESQGAACHQYARERGYTIVAEYVEGDGIRGVSGGNTERDTLTRLLREAKQTPRPFDVLLVYDTSRLARDDFVWFGGWVEAELAQRDIGVEYARERFESGPVGQLTKQILRGVNTFQKQMIVTRGREGHVARAKQGRWSGGPPPLGYNVVDEQLVVNPEEAQLVERIFRLYVEQQLPMDRIGEQLYQEKVPGKWERLGTQHCKKRPSMWSVSGIYKLLTSTTYIGRFRWGKAKNPRHKRWLSAEQVEVPCPRIISDELWTAAQRRLAANRYFGRRDKKHHYLVSGLVRCTLCGRGLHSMPTKKASLNYYVCKRFASRDQPYCQNFSLFRVVDVDPGVWAALAARLTDPQTLHALLAPHLAAAQDRVRDDLRLQAVRERIAVLEQKADEVLRLDTSTPLARERVAKLLATLDQERAVLLREQTSLTAALGPRDRMLTDREEQFQQVRQWLLGTTLPMAGYRDEDHQGTTDLAADLGVAAAPAELQSFLFRLKQQLVRNLVKAVWMGPDGAAEIELKADGSRIPLQVRASRPKWMARST
ncbi:MAG TPA: recombinase family protein [Candidatus Binatia bacterium]|nr:recombinase family protein [Candidatus Binatia bacterium]